MVGFRYILFAATAAAFSTAALFSMVGLAAEPARSSTTASAADSQTASKVAGDFKSQVLPILTTHCGACHGSEKPEARITLVGQRSLDQLVGEKENWFRVLAQVESGAMPPDGEKQLSDAQRKVISGWIRGDFTEMLAARQLKEGRAKLRRLSRSEYSNTVFDLFGLRPAIDKYLPEDGRAGGYDKVSNSLPLSAEGSMGYFGMADDLLKKWVLKPLPNNYASDPASRTVRAPAMESGQSPGHTLKLADGTMVSFNSDTTSGRLGYRGTKVPGIHHIRVSAYAYQTDEPLPFGVYIGNTDGYPQILEMIEVFEAQPGKAQIFETDVYLPQAVGMRLIPFGIGVQVPKNSQASACKGPGLAVQWMEAIEPELPIQGDRWLTADFPPEMNKELRHRRLTLKTGAAKNSLPKSFSRDEFLAVMKKTFERVGEQLFRRPLGAAEIDQVMKDVAEQIDAGLTLDAVFVDKVAELMSSPDFFCVVEEPGELSNFALASRLSYFLWGSTPDQELLEVARQGKLVEPNVLKAQTERLLNDPKAGRFVTDFVGQWLGIRAIDDTSPDVNLYPEYDPLLKTSSLWETEGFFRYLLYENQSVRNFVASDWTYVNERLAKHYGIKGIKGIELQPYRFADESPFGGVWTQPAIMKTTANGTNTTPIRRGLWVADRLLGTPIPPPPPNINPIEPDTRGAKTLREQLALHRGSGACASCHAKFDPFGFALESFDVIGQHREKYRAVDPEVVALPVHKRAGKTTWRDGLPVDPSGVTPDGQAFANIAELRRILAKDPRRPAAGVAKHLLVYGTGTLATPLDQPEIDQIVNTTAADDYGLRSLLHAVIQSKTFRSK